MANITLRYVLLGPTSRRVVCHQFKTEQAFKHFLDNGLPEAARELDVWHDIDDEPKQLPTSGRKQPVARWWAANQPKFCPNSDKPEVLVRKMIDQMIMN